ncbi:MAG: hypothetical protein AB8G11_09120 [Saprospiraceae bacterium]
MRNKNGIKRVKSQRRYPIDLKRKIAKSYLAGEASYAVLAEENGLKNKDVVKEFVKWYRKELLKEKSMEGDKDLKKEVKVKDEISKISTAKALSISEELALLKQELYESKLKVEGLETMIDIAETTYKIAIRKKFGTKQSK